MAKPALYRSSGLLCFASIITSVGTSDTEGTLSADIANTCATNMKLPICRFAPDPLHFDRQSHIFFTASCIKLNCMHHNAVSCLVNNLSLASAAACTRLICVCLFFISRSKRILYFSLCLIILARVRHHQVTFGPSHFHVVPSRLRMLSQ